MAAALDHGQACVRFTSPARTGLRSTYLNTASSEPSPWIGNDL